MTTASLHIYLSQLRAEGANPRYIEAVERNSSILVQRGLPVILSLAHLGQAANAPYNLLYSIVSRLIDPYRVFRIRKRSDGFRYICVPEPALLEAQRWIHKEILCSDYAQSKLDSSCTAYRQKSNHILNAKKHLGAPWLLKIDVVRFFESVSERQVYHVFRSLGYRAIVAFCMARLCTRLIPESADARAARRYSRWTSKDRWKFLASKRVGHLPQGAPTSPMLANLVCSEFDRKVATAANAASLIYSRYADDITVSGYGADRATLVGMRKVICRELGNLGLEPNQRKTCILGKGTRKVITGLSVAGSEIRLPKAYKEQISTELHYARKFGMNNHCQRIGVNNRFSYVLRLYGRILYAQSIERDYGDRARKMFEEIVPDIRDIQASLIR